MYGDDDDDDDDFEVMEMALDVTLFDSMHQVSRTLVEDITARMAVGISRGIPYHVIFSMEIEHVSRNLAILAREADSPEAAQFGYMMLLITSLYDTAMNRVVRDQGVPGGS